MLRTLNRFLLTGIFVFLTSCIGDLYFDSVNSLDPNKISRDEAIQKLFLAIGLKKSLCPQASDSLLLLAGYFTTKQGEGCVGTSTTKESQKRLQSCDSAYSYFEKKDVDVCIQEVLFFSCDPFAISGGNTNFRLNFPICRGMFGPGGRGPTSF